MKIEPNGGKIRTYKVPCLKGICDEMCEVEEIGYVNGILHLRCIECGFEHHGEGVISKWPIIYGTRNVWYDFFE